MVTPLSRLGERGRDLLLWAGVWIGVGWTILEDGDPDPSHTTLLDSLPLWVRAAIWLGAAATALVFAWFRAPRDRFGWLALVVPAMLRAGSYAYATGLWWLGEAFAWLNIPGASLIKGSSMSSSDVWDETLLWGAIVWLVIRQSRRIENVTPQLLQATQQERSRQWRSGPGTD